MIQIGGWATFAHWTFPAFGQGIELERSTGEMHAMLLLLAIVVRAPSITAWRSILDDLPGRHIASCCLPLPVLIEIDDPLVQLADPLVQLHRRPPAQAPNLL